MHQELIEQGKLELTHVQADEIRVKARGKLVWMGIAMIVSTRLWMAGAVSPTRDSSLADTLLQQVRRCCQRLCSLLICTDGWNAYPKSILKVFREKVKRTPGRGRACLEVGPEFHIGTVLKRTVKSRLKEVIPQMTRGSWEGAQQLLETAKGGAVLKTSFIERFNGTMRERLAALTRKCRHASSRLEAFHTGMY